MLKNALLVEPFDLVQQGFSANVYLCKGDPRRAIKVYQRERSKDLVSGPIIQIEIYHLPDRNDFSKYLVTMFDFDSRSTLLPHCVTDLGKHFAVKTLSISNIQNIAMDILNGLDWMRKLKKIYRDFKPENLLFQRDGNGSLSDFGIARMHAETSARHTPLCVRHWYASWEHVSSNYSYEIDIYSFGLIYLSLWLNSIGKFDKLKLPPILIEVLTYLCILKHDLCIFFSVEIN